MKLILQNWDEEFNEIMQRKLKQYKEKRNNIEINYNLNKENYHNIPFILTDYNFYWIGKQIPFFYCRFLGSLVWPS